MTDDEMFKIVAKDLGLPVEKVKDIDRVQWNTIKSFLNNPSFDVLEIPQFCTFVIIQSRMRSTLRYSLRLLKQIKKKHIKYPNSAKYQREYETNKQLFKNLWKLKRECKMF